MYEPNTRDTRGTPRSGQSLEGESLPNRKAALTTPGAHPQGAPARKVAQNTAVLILMATVSGAYQQPDTPLGNT